MSNKKVSYKNLLKQAISEYDTSKTVQVKGPMLDPILSWDGDGEIPIYKDAASILERYYFNENEEEPIMVSDFVEEAEAVEESEYNEDGTEAKTASEKHGEGPGTQQAGTSKASNIKGDLKAQEEDIAKEDVEIVPEEDDTTFSEDTLADDIELFFSEQEEEEEPAEGEADKEPLDVDKKMGEKEGEEAAEKDDDKDDKDDKDEKDEEVEEAAQFTEDAENAVIEKLIDEMEELDEVETTYKGEGPKVKAGPSDMTYDKEGPAPGMEAPDEKKASGPEEDTKGAGTDQAGTGSAEGQIPPRKDQHDDMVKPKSYTAEGDLFDLEEDLDLELLGLEEELEAELADTEAIEEKEWSGKDVPKKKEYTDEQAAPAPSAVPGGPSPKGKGEDEDEDVYEESAVRESFELFKEAIKEDKDDDDEIIV
jgi:hypothetical protein